MPFEKKAKDLPGFESTVKYKMVIIAVLFSILSWFLSSSLAFDQRAVLVTLVLAVVLWVTDAIPLFVTSLLVPVMLIVFGVFGTKAGFAPFFDSVIVLFLGGLLIARGLHNLGLDERFAWWLMSKASNTKVAILLLMIGTAFLSMWMSNTATTAMMLPIGIAIVAGTGLHGSKLSKVVVLGIAYAANIGGIGTLIGSPPNALAVGFLSDLANIPITFLDWMLYGVPLVIILLPVTWLILIRIYKPEVKRIKLEKKRFHPLLLREEGFIGIFLLTILMWLTTSFHGISSSVIALGSSILLFTFGYLKKDDLNSISWSTLLLFGGGLVLGSAILKTGLSETFIATMSSMLQYQPMVFVIFALIVVSVVMGAFLSNTATAALIIPLMVPLGDLLGLNITTLIVTVGIAVSLDFFMPIGTPPNALAFSTGYVKIKDMLRAGLIVGLAAIIVLGLFAIGVWA